MHLLISSITSFFLGAIPSGYLLAKHIKNVDIRKLGSGNIGSTNVRRILGTKLSLLTQIIDISKGIIPVYISFLTYSSNSAINLNTTLSIVAISAILGHNFTPFLNFKGGKGVNTTLGAFLLISPIPVLISVLTYSILKIVTPIVSIRSLCLGLSIPISCLVLKYDSPITIASTFSCLLMFWAHRSNIKRLITGTEK